MHTGSVHVQKRMNDTAPAAFTTIPIGKEYYIFKKHRPQEDKFTLLAFKEEKADFRKLVKELGNLVAWAQFAVRDLMVQQTEMN